MKQNRKYFRLAAVCLLVSAGVLSGCRKEEQPKPPEPVQAEEPVKEQQNIVDGQDNVNISGTVEGLTYTSSDGMIKITLPNDSWHCDSDSEGSVSFSSEEGVISVVRMEGTEVVESSIYHSPEEYVSYLKGTSPTMEGEVVSFENPQTNGSDAFKAVYHYAGDSEYKYVVSSGIGFDDHCYVIGARLLTEDAAVLNAVTESVYNCQIEQ